MRLIYAKPGDIITIGKRGENAAAQVCFDITEWVKLYGRGRVELLHQRPGENEAYPAAVALEGNEARWTVTSTDTAIAGKNYGQAELQYYVGDTLAKSATLYTRIVESLHGPGEKPPPPGQPWYEQIFAELARKVSIQQGAENAGKLLFVDEKGNVALLAVGAGLKIKDGVLVLDGTVTPDEPDKPIKLAAPVIYLETVGDAPGKLTKLATPVIRLETAGEELPDDGTTTPAILGVAILGRTILGDTGGTLGKLTTPVIRLESVTDDEESEEKTQLETPAIRLETVTDEDGGEENKPIKLSTPVIELVTVTMVLDTPIIELMEA